MLFHYQQSQIRILEGSERNIKITEPDRPDHRRGHLQRIRPWEGAGLMKTCIITGASQGIGRAAAVRLSQEPDIQNFVLLARSAPGSRAPSPR